MADKDEICRALDLLVRMTDAYAISINNMEQAERPFRMLAQNMVARIKANMRDTEDDDIKAVIKVIDEDIKLAKDGMGDWVSPMEKVRNAIHQNPAIRVLYLGEPELSSEVLEGMEALEDGTVAQANSIFQKLYSKVTCTLAE